MGAGVTGPGASGARGHLIAFGHPVAPLSRGQPIAVAAINWRAVGFVVAARLAGPHGIGQTPQWGTALKDNASALRFDKIGTPNIKLAAVDPRTAYRP